ADERKRSSKGVGGGGARAGGPPKMTHLYPVSHPSHMSDTLQREISALVRTTKMTGRQSCIKRLRLGPAVIICLLCFSAGGSTNAATEPLQQSQDEVVCDDAEGHGESRACLERLKGMAERAGDTLRLRLSTGKTKVYTGNSHA